MFLKKCLAFLIALSAVQCQEEHQKKVCGSPRRTTGNVVNGEDFKRGDFPWVVALTYTVTNPPTFICSGTLVSADHVITAAHCVRRRTMFGESTVTELLPKDVLALFGAYNLSNPNESGRTILSAEEIHVFDRRHPNEQSDADIAILKFEDDEIPLTRYIRPVCLWEFQDAPNETAGTVAGWGSNANGTKKFEEILVHVEQTVKSSENCFLETAELGTVGNRRTFYAGWPNGTGVGLGGSGNGFFIQVNNIFYLKGIALASRTAAPSCDVKNYTIYTDVMKFKAWIDTIFEGEVVEVKNVTVGDCSKVKCVIKDTRWNLLDRNLKTCGIEDLPEAMENVIIDSPRDVTVEGLSVQLKRDFASLPQNVAVTFPRLMGVSVTYCGLTAVNENAFKGLRNLKFLFLDENSIETIATGAFRDLVKLKQLSLKYNQLQTLNSSVFQPLRSLKELSLSGNGIQSLEPTIFDSMTRLETLNLDTNQIKNLSKNMFEKLTNLKKLSLEANQISALPPNLFSKNPKLEQILLSENILDIIPASTFDSCGSLKLVDLQYNTCVDELFQRENFVAMRKHLALKCSRVPKLG